MDKQSFLLELKILITNMRLNGSLVKSNELYDLMELIKTYENEGEKL